MLKKSEFISNLSSFFIFIGLVVFISMLFFGEVERVWHAYLLGYIYFVLLALGGVFFISVHYASHAVWSVNIRRLAEALTAYLPWACVLTLPMIFGAFYLYDWLDATEVAKDPLLQHKSPYLNLPFFLVRLVIFFSGWIFFAKSLVKFSLKQDQDGRDIHSSGGAKYSIGFLLFFCLSLSFFSVDFLMSLSAHWFSTIFGVYVFAGLFQSVFAILILLSVYLMSWSEYRKLITLDHLHDLGKFLLAATVFWAYIAFSQYMLIWYANLPEETTFFIARSQGGWVGVSVSLIIFKFVVPFLMLLPRWVKRNVNVLVPIACLILLMQAVDVYWLIYPHWSTDRVQFGLLEIATLLGFAGVFIRSIFSFLWTHSPVPLKDPQIAKSSAHKVTY